MRNSTQFDSFNYFDSLNEYKLEAEKSTGRQRHWAEHPERDDNWYGSDNLEHYYEIMETGYELDKIDASLKGMSTNDNYALQANFDVTGSDVEMGRYMTGDPNCMIDYQLIQSNKYITIVCGSAELGNMKTNRVFKRLIAICSIIDRLELDNYRVRLMIGTANVDFGDDHHNLTLVNIKNYDENLSLVKLAAVLHPSYHRRLTFLYRGGHKEYLKNGGSGMGRSGSEEDAMSALEQSGYMKDNYIYLPSVTELVKGENNSETTFTKEHDAMKYADYVIENIDRLTVQI